MDDLKIIKAGKSGTGILVEQDAGFIDPNDKRNKSIITEITNNDKGTNTPLYTTNTFTVFVILQKYGVLNRNGRIYPETILKSQAKAYEQLIKERRAIGEHNHPESSIISGDRVSHNITKMWWEGNTLVGEMEILMSRGYVNYGIISCQGDSVAHLLEHKIMIGVSSRGVGSLVEGRNGEQIVQDDFELLCWDVVTGPSTPGAWIFKNKPQITSQFNESEIKNNPLLNDGLNKFLL